ncbi:MAG: chemotaxis protein CheB [Ruminococcus sp.]|nr:chemotaxis protein CheB [Ruminococcus sp.]
MKLLIITTDEAFGEWLRDSLPDAKDTVCSGYENARAQLLKDKPDALLLDAQGSALPEPAAYIAALCPRYYVPIIVLTSRAGMNHQLISAGATDVINRRPGEEGRQRLLRRITGSLDNIIAANRDKRPVTAVQSAKVIAIGGSTGSTTALPVILKQLPANCPPIVCVLHMQEGYTGIYAEQLNKEVPQEVVEAKNGMYLRQGTVIIAQAGKHLRVFRDRSGYVVKSEAGVRICGHCPSVNVLFDSVAFAAKKDAIGVILTGMGSDGAAGMLTMRKLGAYNIAQDESSSVVYGMPAEAVREGAVHKECRLERIAAAIKLKI